MGQPFKHNPGPTPAQTAIPVYMPVATAPVTASDFAAMDPISMAKQEMAKVIASLSNICVFGLKESNRVAAAKVLVDVALNAKYQTGAKDRDLDKEKGMPSNWRNTLMGLPKAA